MSLIFYKNNDQKLIKQLNNLIYKISFNPFGLNEKDRDNKDGVNFTQKSEILPLYILYSKDNFEEIGDPKVFSEKGADILTLWEDTYNSLLRENNEENNYKNEEENNNKNNLIKELKEKYMESRLDEELIIFE